MDRLVQVAIARHMPAQADARAQAAADGRRFDIDTRQHDLAGTATVYGTLDLADALDLETAVAGVAATLKDLGSTDTLDVRRAAAVGEIARHQPTLDLTTTPSDSTKTTDRRVVLHVHLSEEAITGTDGVGRLGNLGTPITAQQIRTWCGTAGQIAVKPVIDLADCTPVDAYEIPDRITDQVDLRDRRRNLGSDATPSLRSCDEEVHQAGPAGSVRVTV